MWWVMWLEHIGSLMLLWWLIFLGLHGHMFTLTVTPRWICTGKHGVAFPCRVLRILYKPMRGVMERGCIGIFLLVLWCLFLWVLSSHICITPWWVCSGSQGRAFVCRSSKISSIDPGGMGAHFNLRRPFIWQDEMMEVRELFRRVERVRRGRFSGFSTWDGASKARVLPSAETLSKNRLRRRRAQCAAELQHLNYKEIPYEALTHVNNIRSMCSRIQCQASSNFPPPQL